MTTQTLILSGVFVYFAIGAMIALSLSVFSMGFSGRFEPMAIAILFFWPFFYLMQIPYVLFVLVGLAVAGGLTWLASIALQYF